MRFESPKVVASNGELEGILSGKEGVDWIVMALKTTSFHDVSVAGNNFDP